MSDGLVIELGADAETIRRVGILGPDIRWVDADALVSRGDAVSRDAVFVLDGTLVASHLVALPDFADNKILKILPGLMEDKVSTTDTERHFALIGDRKGEDGKRVVAVVDVAVMEKVQHLARMIGVSVQALVPDYCLLNKKADGISAFNHDGCVVVRNADGTGFSAEPEQAQIMLNDDVVPAPLSEAAWQDHLRQAPYVEINLLQGGFAPRGNILTSFLWLKRAGVLAAASVVVWAAGLVWDASANREQAAAFYNDAEQIFRLSLPNVSRIVNMEAQMRRAVADVRQQGGGEFFALSERVFQAVQDNRETMLETLRYDSENGALVLNVSFSSFAESEDFKRRLQQSGGRVVEGSSRQEGSRVFSELTVGRAQ